MWLLEREYDIRAEERAVRNEHLRDQHNRTACRSPSREADVLWFKQEQRHKRQQEFAKRRPNTDTTTTSTTTTTTIVEGRAGASGSSKFKVTAVKRPIGTRLGPPARGMLTSTRRPLITLDGMGIPKDDVKSTSKSSCSMQVRSGGKAGELAAKQARLNLISTVRTQVHHKRTITTKKERVVLGEKNQQKTQQTPDMQTEPGVVAVKEEDVLLLTDYLQEALAREAALRMKLTSLQRNTATLLRSTEFLWKTRCSEDLLRSQIKALESQVQVCTQDLTQDGVKALVEMERQRGEEEQKVLLAAQRGAEDRAEAEAKIQGLQEALQAATAESSVRQGECEALHASCAELQGGLEARAEQLEQLRSQLERCQGRECELGQQLEEARQTNEELRYRLAQLEGQKRAVSAQLQEARDMLSRAGAVVLRERPSSPVQQQQPPSLQPSVQPIEPSAEEGRVAGQLQATQEKLKMKEEECMELQAQLAALELECRSYQSSVMQCREELRQLRNQRSRQTSWKWRLASLPLLVLFGAALLVVLCLYSPILADHLQDILMCVHEHVDEYLMTLASPQTSACFRPI
ncbi:TRAF3-interacting JNK-activating modulator [Engraulis encrasicolus]|uniref:TRAF3-interacting JNK-activating modulator n=1 Tax=Engraulis encrasicolus TaxID=184585 RepID=UPI002FD38F51